MRTMFVVLLLLLAATHSADGQEKKKKKGDLRREVPLKAGDAAPDFAVQNVEGKKTVKLSELKGKPVVLIFGSCT